MALIYKGFSPWELQAARVAAEISLFNMVHSSANMLIMAKISGGSDN